MKTFEKACVEDIRKIKPLNKYQHNLTHTEMLALNHLIKDNEVVIKPADKGGGVVILDRQQYLSEIQRQLQDVDTYEKLPSDPSLIIANKYRSHLTKGVDLGILNNHEHDFLLPKCPIIPVIYVLPKLHKDPICPPGRPIVSGIGSILSPLSEHIDHILQPIVVTQPAYLKDSISLLQILDGMIWMEGSYMVTCDVGSLYTIIEHPKGCEAVRYYMELTKLFPLPQIDYVIDGINLILNNNFFWFEGDFYLQRRGTAMGTRFAPSYANLFMSYWENQFVYSGHDWGSSLVLYRRYIDDIFFIWRGDLISLNAFLNHLNSNTWGISLTTDISDAKVHFLDLEILREGNTLITKTYFKQVDINSFIHIESCHHAPWLTNIPKGQILRIRRNCSKLSDFEEQAELLKKQFVQ
uniref:Helix-turn-helix domain-containing protein n=1 Tax=Leptobrachium leishanense TaxID=445787 RepID=A0A8C5PH59_9ANUR